MDKYQFIYKETYSKTSTCFPIPKLNNFITDEYYKIKQIDRLLLPEKKKETLFAERIIKTYLE